MDLGLKALESERSMAVGAREQVVELEEEVSFLEEELAASEGKRGAGPGDPDKCATCTSPRRRRLPDTRNALTHKFEISASAGEVTEGYITVGMFEDGTPGEVFITVSKEGSTVGGLCDSLAQLVSLAIQYGVPLETLVRKLSFQKFEPSGYTANPKIRRANSIVDYIARWLGGTYLPKQELEKGV